MTKWHGRALGLTQLSPRRVDADTKDGTDDWRYRVTVRHQF